MKIHAIAIDDEVLALKKILRYAETIGYLEVDETFTGAGQSLAYVKEHEVDLIFLDIQMEGFSGIEFLESLQKKPRIILTTAYETYALKGFELGVVDYLLKPIGFQRFLKAVERVYLLLEQDALLKNKGKYTGRDKGRYVFLKSGKKEVKVFLEEILYIEGMQDYLKVHTTAQRIITLHSFHSILDLLDSDNFLRVHKSFIVALDKIQYLEHHHVSVGGRKIPVSMTYRLLLRERMGAE